MEIVLIIAVLSIVSIVVAVNVVNSRKLREIKRKLRDPNSAYRFLNIDIPEHAVFYTAYGELLSNVQIKELDGKILLYYQRLGETELQHKALSRHTDSTLSDLLAVAIKVGETQRERLVATLNRFFTCVRNLRSLSDSQRSLLLHLDLDETTDSLVFDNYVADLTGELIMEDFNCIFRRVIYDKFINGTNRDILINDRQIEPISINQLDELVSKIELNLDRALTLLKQKFSDKQNLAMSIGNGEKIRTFKDHERVRHVDDHKAVYVFVRYLEDVEFSETFGYPLDCIISDQQGKFKKDFSGNYLSKPLQ